MPHCIRDDLKIWTPQTVARRCTITLIHETDEHGGSVPAKTPLRTLQVGDKITVTGGGSSCHYFRLGGKSGERVSARMDEFDKIFVED